MATNPDFTKLNLEDHPSCDYNLWKDDLEKTTGKKYDDLYDTTLNVFRLRLSIRRTSIRNAIIWIS